MGAAIELTVKVAGATFAALYVVGLIVVNIYLAEFDFFAFSYARPQYILTGLWTVLTFAATVLPVSAAAWLLRRRRVASLFPAVGSLAGSALLLALAPAVWFVALQITHSDTPPLLGAAEALGCCLMFGLTLAVWMLPVSGKPGRIQPVAAVGAKNDDGTVSGKARAAVAGLLTAFSVLLFAQAFALTVYPGILPAYGGGRPQRARVILEGAAIADLARMGFPMRAGANISLPVSILGETGEEVLIKTDTLRFRLLRTLVKAANPKTFPDDSMWERKEFYDLYKEAASQDCLDPGAMRSRLDETVNGYRIPLHQPDLYWECGLNCYNAIHQMEETVRDEQVRCKKAEKP